MYLQISPDYIKDYMAEIRVITNEILKLEKSISKRAWLKSINRKTKFVENYIDEAVKKHNDELDEMARDMDIFREANDFKEEIKWQDRIKYHS